MRWRKLGPLFDPRAYRLPDGCTEFAQSPQALVCDGFVRIYFSTRSVDNGKFRSRVSYVDMTETLDRVLGVANHEVIELGNLGAFDEHGIFPFSPLWHNGVVLGYTCGWSRRVAVSVETAIGLAISQDGGRRFERVGQGPVLAASLREPCLVGDAFVQVINGRFHMWYIFGTGWRRYQSGGVAERIYKIAHAESDDGVAWEKSDGRQIVADRLGPDECQALPTVVRVGNRYHMFFCYRQAYDFRTNAARGYRIGHAWSDDLVSWTRDDERPAIEVGRSGWDSEMMCYPNAFVSRGQVYLLYNGNAFGRFGFGRRCLNDRTCRRSPQHSHTGRDRQQHLVACEHRSFRLSRSVSILKT